jgi:hypothetical protein
LDAVKNAVDAAAAKGARPDEQKWDIDPAALTAAEDAFEEATQLLKVGLKGYSVRIAHLHRTLTSRQADAKITKLDADMSLAIKEDDSRLANLKEKRYGVRVFHQRSLLSHHPKQKPVNPPTARTIAVTLARRINGALGKPEGRIMSLDSGYQTLTRALAHSMRGDTKLSAILWRERNASPNSGLTSIRANTQGLLTLDLGLTVQDLAQNNKVTLIISS